jgi:hypothetical protein
MLKLQKLMVVSPLSYGCENCNLKAAQMKRIQAAEMRFLKWVTCYTLLNWSEKVRIRLKICCIPEKIKRYRIG